MARKKMDLDSKRRRFSYYRNKGLSIKEAFRKSGFRYKHKFRSLVR